MRLVEMRCSNAAQYRRTRLRHERIEPLALRIDFVDFQLKDGRPVGVRVAVLGRHLHERLGEGRKTGHVVRDAPRRSCRRTSLESGLAERQACAAGAVIILRALPAASTRAPDVIDLNPD
ncbi:hypothetical protein [Jiella sp. M17.18]|uniref:hypothetical protein n=1 Tax=Jiella sp. M17.18 TaxID=3234247 RepID=UPI0034DFB9D6